MSRPRVSEDLAARRLREHPTVPPHASVDAVNADELWPRVFCAFNGCAWAELCGTEEQLEEHLRQEHAAELAPICARMLRGKAPDALRSAYNEAIAVKCRGQAPRWTVLPSKLLPRLLLITRWKL